jgi:hypothetical protein
MALLYDLWILVLSVLGSAAVMGAALLVPAIREAVGRYVARFVQHHFDERIERLKSELRQSEEKFAAGLRASQQQLSSLADAALSLRSSRQVALDGRRLQAVELLWKAKVAADRMRLAAKLVSHLNMEEMFNASERNEPGVTKFAEMLDKLTGVDFKKEGFLVSAVSEQPFLPPNVWALFLAYQGVMIQSVMKLKILAIGTTKFLKKEDQLKPTMLAALPEYKSYIEQYGFSGHYHLLDPLERKLIDAIREMLEGREADDATLKRSAEIVAAAQKLKLDTDTKIDIPAHLRGPEVPDPPKM